MSITEFNFYAKMISGHDVAADPLTDPIRDAIAAAKDVHQLLRLTQVTIPHCVGISDDERADLQLAVRTRSAQLSAAGEPIPRWNGFHRPEIK
jgi:hypothetical protein